MAEKTKVLLVQGVIPNYRVPVFNLLAQQVDLTVLYSDGELPAGVQFHAVKVPVFRIRYKIHKKNLRAMARRYDVVICTSDTSYLYTRLLHLRPRRYRLVYWGIGVSASYNERYDANPKTAEAIKKLTKRADAMVFYSDYPVKKYAACGIPSEKLFVAPNTVAVQPISSREKDSYLFVGSLYKQKKVECLLEGYLAAWRKCPDIRRLVIVGDGSEREAISAWVRENGLTDKIELTGAIFDEARLAELFSGALACISPDQAGLSVLKSMGYGVPFVTSRNAITGGEIFNIGHNVNGVLMDSPDGVEAVLLDAQKDPKKYLLMGERAQNYYQNNRLVSHMADGFMSAIHYAISH